VKRFFIKIARFFWSWGFLKFVLWMITLVVLLYVEEDWRGARAWAVTKAEWESKGESFDYNRLIPPPVPDDQNLAAIPLFKVEPDPENKGSLAPLNLQKAYRIGMPGNNLYFSHLGNWEASKLTDMAQIRKGIAADFAEVFPGAPLPANSLAQFDALYPFVTDFRAAAASRPYCRFPHEYPPQAPFNDLLTFVSSQIKLAQVLNYHALLALDDHQPEAALSDVQLNFKLVSGVMQEPFIVSGLVAIGMTAIDMPAVYDGLVLHAWNDAQLAELQNGLGQLDFLKAYQNCLRGELGVSIPMLDGFKSNRNALSAKFQQDRDASESKTTLADRLGDWLNNAWPDGWIDWNKAHVITTDLSAVRYFDLPSRMVFPNSVDRLAAENSKARGGSGALVPWNIFEVEVSPVLISAAQKFSREQVCVDEARIACALERYRLAHDACPTSLDALVPACIAELPHDVMNGEPYHYQLRSDGTYLLYSVGWNQTDEGGKIAYKKDAPTQVDYAQGDWVWPTPQATPGKSTP